MNLLEVAFGAAGRAVGSALGGARAGYVKAMAAGPPWARAMYSGYEGDWGHVHAEDLVANERAFLVNSWVNVCVNVIATAGAGLPLNLYRKKGQDRRAWERVLDHPILDLIEAPNPDAQETDFDLLEALFADWELAGSWFLYVLRDEASGLPQRMYRLRPDLVRVIPSETRRVAGYRMCVNGETLDFSREDVYQSRTFHPTDDLNGLSRLAAAEIAVMTDTESALWNFWFFRNGAQPGAVLQTEKRLDPEVKKQLRLDWEKGHKGTPKAHRTAILEQGLTYEPTSLPHKDMEFAMQRRMSREEIVGAFGVPPFLVGILEYANYANAEAQLLSFWRDKMRPKLRKMQRGLTKALCVPYDPSLVLEFDLTTVVALIQDQLDMAKVDKELTGCGMYTINERRRERGLPPVAWGDVFWQQIQYVPVKDGDALPGLGGAAPASGGGNGEGKGQAQTAPPVRPKIAGRPLYSDPRAIAGRVLAWEGGVVAPSRRQFEGKLQELLARQEKDVLARIRKDQRSPVHLRELVKRHAQAALEGEDPGPEQLKQSAEVLIESWLFERDYWATGALRAVHPTLLNLANVAGGFVLGELGLSLDFQLMDHGLQEALKAKEQVFAESWTDSTLGELRGQLSESVLEGENARERVERVQRTFDGRKRNAPVVAQTETGAVSNMSSVAGYKQSGVVVGKEWHAGGPNPRPHHAEANGQVVGLDEDFQVGGEGLPYPGYPHARPDNVCNCHCTALPVLPEL